MVPITVMVSILFGLGNAFEPPGEPLHGLYYQYYPLSRGSQILLNRALLGRVEGLDGCRGNVSRLPCCGCDDVGGETAINRTR